METVVERLDSWVDKFCNEVGTGWGGAWAFALVGER